MVTAANGHQTASRRRRTGVPPADPRTVEITQQCASAGPTAGPKNPGRLSRRTATRSRCPTAAAPGVAGTARAPRPPRTSPRPPRRRSRTTTTTRTPSRRSCRRRSRRRRRARPARRRATGPASPGRRPRSSTTCPGAGRAGTATTVGKLSTAGTTRTPTSGGGWRDSADGTGRGTSMRTTMAAARAGRPTRTGTSRSSPP